MKALVTGVTRGIGRSLVDHLVSGGWEVAAVGRRAEALRELALQWGPHVTPHVADASDHQAVAAVASAADPLDLVIANVGALMATGPLWESDPTQWWAGVEVNLRSAHATAHAVLPAMVARGAGRLVLMSSGTGNAPGPWQSSYASAKAAVTVMGESIELELADTGVHCFVVSPGMVRTDMTRFPEPLTRHVPQLADIADDRFLPVERFLGLIDEIASGRLDPLAGRFVHASDDRDRLLATWDPADPRPRTLRMAPGFDGDPHAL